MVVLGRGGVSYEPGTPVPALTAGPHRLLQGVDLYWRSRRVVTIKTIEKDDLPPPMRADGRHRPSPPRQIIFGVFKTRFSSKWFLLQTLHCCRGGLFTVGVGATF